MSEFVFTTTAREDLKAIWRYIARDSVRHADLVEEAVLAACRFAAERPEAGHQRAELEMPQVLFQTVRGYKRYSIAYLAGSRPVRILRVVHGARDVPKLFGY